jgi:hypothetical protein
VGFGSEGEVIQSAAQPLLWNSGRRMVQFRLPSNVTRFDVEKSLGSTPTNGGLLSNLMLELPGAEIKAAHAQVNWNGNDLIVVLLRSEERTN